MIATSFKKKLLHSTLLALTITLPTCLIAADGEYTSQFINQSNKSKGYKLVKTRMWPGPECLLDTGKQIINPGETSMFKIKKDNNCNQAGIGYEIYRADDTKNANLFGYVSHRFADGKFSVQISRFCNGDKCLFSDLNPEQNR